jgi:methionyl-tRNA synthetase
VIDPIAGARRFGPDPLRLYLVKEIAFGGDGDFSWERFDERYNVDLANNLGNLVSRVSSMAGRYRGGRLVPSGEPASSLATLGEDTVRTYRDAMDRLAMHEATAAVFRLIDATNAYLADSAPWTMAKDANNADRLGQTLYDAAEAIRLAAVLLVPVMPTSASEILRRVGAPGTPLLERDGRWRNEGDRFLSQEGPLWPRHEKETHVDQVTPPPTAPPVPAAAADNRISIDDFMKVELRVAKVLAAERVPKSSKLLKLSVDVGSEQRTIVAGVAEAYEPDTLVGRTVAIVFNLKPAKLMGVESNGMVLAASPDGGRPILVNFDEPPPPGTRVR